MSSLRLGGFAQWVDENASSVILWHLDCCKNCYHNIFMNSTSSYQPSVAVGDLDAQARGTFVSRTYGHLFGAVVAFMLIEIFLFKAGLAEPKARAMLGTSWLLVLGGFVVVSW